MIATLTLTLVLAQAGEPERISFEDAVKRALERHPAMAIARADVARATALVEQARAPSLPSLVANGTFTRLDDDRRLGDRLVLGKEQLNGNLQAAVPLVNTPRWAQWYRAAKSEEGIKATADDVKRQVALNAARAWLLVLGQRRVVDAATNAQRTARAHLDYSSERRQGGVGNRLDELRAAQEYEVSTQQLENARAALVRAQEQLGVQTGSDDALDVVADEPALPVLADAKKEGLERERLDVQAALTRSDVARAATTLDWMDYLPLVNAVFQPFYQNPPSLTQPLTGWQLNLVLQIPLYDGGLRYGQAHERRANLKSAEAQLDATLRQAKSELRAAFKTVTHADAALEAARGSAKRAAEALELANEAWKAGATTNLEVIDAERRARDAEVQQALAEDASRQARLELLVAGGAFPR